MRFFRKINLVIFFIISLLFTNTLWALPTINQILAEIDRQQEMVTDITAKIKITQKKPAQGIKVMEMIYYRRDKDDAFLIVMIAPDSEKGNGYLRIGDNMWLYRRNTRTFQHIGRDERIGGSDMSTGDAESREFSETYKPALDSNGREIIAEETLGSAKIPVYRIEVIATVDDVKYPKQIIWVALESYLILKVESYSLSGTLMETAYYAKYTIIEGRYIPLLMKFIDRFEEGNMSVVELSGISLKKIDDSIFDKTYLENLSR